MKNEQSLPGVTSQSFVQNILIVDEHKETSHKET